MKSFSEIISYIKPLDGWLSSHEGYFLYTAAKEATHIVGVKQRGEIVEIGSWKGKSTICLASGSENTKVFAIDPHKGEYSKGKGIGKSAPTYREFIANLKSAGVNKKVIPVVATSEEAAKKWKAPISLLFIDGLHDYKHTKQDYDLWSPFVMDNGIIAFHDAFCGHIGPEKVILQDIVTSNNYKEIGVVGSIIYAKKGKPNLLEYINLLRTTNGIKMALVLNRINMPGNFFLIHRIIKLLLLNHYTQQILLKEV